jgi:hypothetical protein
MQLWKWLSGALAVGLMPFPVSAAEPIGAAVVVVNQVTAALASETRTLQSGNGVHQDELIEVASDASSELKLNDETRMALGPGAKLRLDKFVYDAQQTKGDIAVNLVKGAFRFVTGVAAKPSYVVRVPQASITVRGTIFDVYVQDNGISWLLLHEGAVQVCNDGGKCQVLDEPGKLLRISDGGDVEPPARWTKLKHKTNFDDAFPFVRKKPQDSPPVLTREAILIDIDIPKKKKVRDRHPPKDHATDTTRPKTKKRPQKADKVDKTDRPSKPKRKVARNRRGGDDDSAIMDGMGIAIGIGGGIRIGGGGRRGGGGGSSRPGGRSAN